MYGRIAMLISNFIKIKFIFTAGNCSFIMYRISNKKIKIQLQYSEKEKNKTMNENTWGELVIKCSIQFCQWILTNSYLSQLRTNQLAPDMAAIYFSKNEDLKSGTKQCGNAFHTGQRAATNWQWLAMWYATLCTDVIDSTVITLFLSLKKTVVR